MLENLQALLTTRLFSILDRSFTLGELLMVPLLLIVGWWLINKLAHLATFRLRKTGASADSVHLFKRIFYILALGVLFITTLDILNVPLTAFTFLSGAVAIGFGFGAQNIITALPATISDYTYTKTEIDDIHPDQSSGKE